MLDSCPCLGKQIYSHRLAWHEHRYWAMSTTDNPGDPKLRTWQSSYSRIVAALRYPDFRVLWIATVPNQLGQGIQQVLLGWLVFEMTNSSGMVGVAFAVRSAPNLIVGFAAGSVTDRLDRRTIMRISTWGMLLLSLVLALLLYGDRLTVWHLLLATFFMGTLQAFYMTSRQAYVYDVVGAGVVVNGIALVFLAQLVGGIFGAFLAGWSIDWWGPGTSFMVMGISYAVGAFGLYGLRFRGESAPQTREPMSQNLLNYFRELKTNRVMLSLMISTTAAEVLGFSHQVMLPVLAKDVLHVGPTGLGVLTAFRFVGGALGAALLTAVGEVRRRGLLLLVVLALFGVGQVLLSQSSVFWMALLFVTFINVMATATDILHQILLQFSVPNQQRGRAMGSWIVGIGTAPVGQLEIGYLAAVTNARLALLTNGIGLAVLAVVLGLLLPRLRRL